MTTARTAQNFIALEPDQARDYCVNLIRKYHGQFSVEIDPSIRGMKDCVVVYRGGELIKREGWSRVPKVARTMDDACQYVANLIGTELSFQCNARKWPDGRGAEWQFLVEVRSEGRTGA
jgi:hypothetical protein